MNDCGLAVFDNDFLQLCGLTQFSLLEEVKEKLLWGTYGKEGRGPFKWVRLKDCTTDHLKAILETQTHIPAITIQVIKEILVSRGHNANNRPRQSSKTDGR